MARESAQDEFQRSLGEGPQPKCRAHVPRCEDAQGNEHATCGADTHAETDAIPVEHDAGQSRGVGREISLPGKGPR